MGHHRQRPQALHEHLLRTLRMDTQPTENELGDALKSMFSIMLSKSVAAKKEWALEVIPLEYSEQMHKVLLAGNLKQFNRMLNKPLDDLRHGLLETFELNDKARFLVMEYDFVRRHLSRVFQDLEGAGCSTDKTHTVMSAMFAIEALKNFKPFNYEGKYTFHLPEKILKDEASIQAFLTALYHLFNGHMKPYAEAYHQLLKEAGVA